MRKFAGDIIFHMRTKNHNHMMHGSWDTEWDRQNYLSFWVIFLSLYPPRHPLKNQNFEKKWKKCLEILSFYTYMCTINEDHMIYGSWNIRCDRQKFLSFWAIFCPFSPLTTWKIKILTLKKTPGDIIILHICTINDNHMMYGSWGMERNRHNFLLFWTVFCPLPTYGPKKKHFEKMKKAPEDIIILQMCTINDSHMMYGSWDMECHGQMFFSFWTVFSLFFPNNLKNQNFEKMAKKTPGDIINLHMCTIITIIWCMVPEI